MEATVIWVKDAQECEDLEKYLENNDDCSNNKFFTYTPHDENNPCDGGVAKL